ncbi:MAG: tRNA 2-thiouridine(34) synthase MnmA [Nanoarchaeota archaeon]|nr:tRNA 2-thiouridine(34) synthase MnmA [Nanoarchaeota archaeon]
MKTKKPKVLIAISGGVDSSVAALLMKKKDYEIVGAFMKNYSDSKNEFGECNWREERRVAIKIASMLDIPLITLDFEKQYKKQVVEKMFENYKRGKTPNPDIDCNQKIKFPLLIKAAEKINADFVVTGHYARIKQNKKTKEYELLRGKDESKDQSYFLYRLSQKDLSKSLFPIGDYTKKQIREIARKNKFPNYDKKSTVGICFIGKINLKKFLQKKIKPKKGKILNPQGEQIGTHDGIYYYTIGQRIGPRFGIEIKKENNKKMDKWYVVKKDAKRNVIIAAPEGHKLNFRKEIFIENPHWINPDEKPKNNSKILSRIRQVGELLPSKVSLGGGKGERSAGGRGKYKITLNKPITGVSEGQAIVLYKNEKCLGGGEISFE